mgnify:CR=1 FL=1
MSLKKYNRTGINWSIETEGFPYVKLSDLKEGETYVLRGCFVTPDNGYGEGAVFITDGQFVNIPQRYVELVNTIRSTKEDVQDIIDGKVGFHYQTFQNPKYKNLGYTIVFDDIQ